MSTPEFVGKDDVVEVMTHLMQYPTLAPSQFTTVHIEDVDLGDQMSGDLLAIRIDGVWLQDGEETDRTVVLSLTHRTLAGLVTAATGMFSEAIESGKVEANAVTKVKKEHITKEEL